MESHMDFPEALRRTMFEFRINGMKLARDSGVNRSQISQFVNDKSGLSVANLQRIVNSLTPDQQAYMFSLVSGLTFVARKGG